LHDARRSALEKAKGEWISFLDTDDYWLPGKLIAQFAIIDEFEKTGNRLGFVYGRTKIVSPDGEIDAPFAHEPLPEGMIFSKLIRINFVPLLTVLVRRVVFDEVGGIDPAISQAGDYSAWLRITKQYPVRALQELCAVYRWHPDNLSQKKAARLLYETYLLKFVRYHYFDWELVESTWALSRQWILGLIIGIGRPVKRLICGKRRVA